jgi:hypothetical protein
LCGFSFFRAREISGRKVLQKKKRDKEKERKKAKTKKQNQTNKKGKDATAPKKA